MPGGAMTLSVLAPFAPERLERARFAGFDRLQLRIGPGFPIDTEDDSLREAREAAVELEKWGFSVASLGFYRNMLEPDLELRRAESRRLRNVLRMAAEVFRAPVVGVFAGRQPDLSIEENIPLFREVWEPMARLGEDLKVRIAFENCSMFRDYPVRGINMSHTPAAYRLMFAAIPSPTLGIEFDPSHCLKQQIDPARFLREFGSRIYHVHAKDHERLAEAEYEHGCFDPRSSRDRLPGLGQIDFDGMFRVLGEIGYAGDVALEAERDPKCPDEAALARGHREARLLLEKSMARL